MAEIRVAWERVINLRPYESLRINLGVTETVRLPPEQADGTVDAKQASALAVQAAKASAIFFEQLAKIGDELVKRHRDAS